MGRAILLKNLGEAEYLIEYRLNEAVILAKIDEIAAARITNGEKKIETEVKLVQAQIDQRALDAQVIAILHSTTLPPAEKNEQARIATAAQRAQRLVIVTLEGELGFLALEKTSLGLQQQRYEDTQTRIEKTVWSADYSPDLEITENEVGTVEIMGDEREILLQPAKNLFRPWNGATDGEMTPMIAQAPIEWLLSTCLVTGWQRYLPTYRFAEVLEIIDQDRLKIALIEPKKSLYDDIDVTPLNADQSLVTYTDVSCVYLDCNTRAFAVGDEVLVHYQDQNPAKPEVIGFRHNPEPCDALNVYTSVGERLRYAPRPPGAWVSIENPTVPRFGSCYWTGDGGAVSWVGWRARYFASPNGDDDFTSRSLYHKGLDFGPCPGIVLGGCVRKKHLFAVCRVGTREVLSACPVAGKREWTEIAGIQASTWPVLAPWYFSRTGGKAASAKSVGNATQIVELTRSTSEEQPPFSASFQARSTRPWTETSSGAVGSPSAHILWESIEHDFACDYVGESLVTLDRESTGQQNLDEFGFYTLFLATSTVIRCGAFSGEFPHGREETQTVITYDLEFGTFVIFEDTRTLFPVGILEHLNVTGGEGHIVSVTRLVSGVRTTRRVVGVGEGITLKTATATQRMGIRAGEVGLSGPSVSASVSAPLVDGVPVLTPQQQKLFALFDNQLPDPATTVATRTGHLVTSMPLVGTARALPPLPVGSPLRVLGGGPIGAG